MIKGIDVSAYQGDVPWSELVKNAGLQFAIVKGDQGAATDDHVTEARAGGVNVVGLYFWDDPTIAVKLQVECFAQDIRKHNPDFIWLDVEQWWSSWQQYWDYLGGKLPAGNIERLGGGAISEHAKGVLEGLRGLFPGKVIGVYTAQWFINSYALPAAAWLGKWPLWIANYPAACPAGPVSWAELASTPPWPFEVLMPAGTEAGKWDIWQYSSTMITPAQNAKYDWNVFKGEVNDLLVWVGKAPVVPPGPTMEERVAALERRVATLEGGQAHPLFIPRV